MQTIDTTDSYSNAAKHYYALEHHQEPDPDKEITKAGLNWENVNKRILPQIIYKGHTLRREERAQVGLSCIVPETVYKKIVRRIGDDLVEYPRGP